MPSIPVNSLELNSPAVNRTAMDHRNRYRSSTYSNESSSISGRPALRQGIKNQPAILRVEHEASWDTSRSKFEW